jgi:tetratricopeptide (TPR) repeat protein
MLCAKKIFLAVFTFYIGISFCYSQLEADSLRKIISVTVTDTIRSELFGKLAQLYVNSDLKTAVKYADSGIVAAKKSGNKRFIALAIHTKGNVYYKSGDYKNAFPIAFEALKIWEEINDLKGLAGECNSIGLFYKDNGKADQALQFFNRALQLRRQAGDLRGTFSSLANIGLTYFDINKYSEAEKAFLAAQEIVKKTGNKFHQAWLFSRMGNLYGEMGDVDKALQMNLKALALDEEIADANEIAGTMNSIGDIYVLKKQFAEGKKYYLASLKRAEALNSFPLLYENYQDIATVADSLNDIPLAYQFLKQFISVKDSMFNAESSKQIAEMKEKYESAKKDQEIMLLGKEKEKSYLLRMEETKRHKTIMWFVISVLLMVGVFAFLIFRKWREAKQQKLIIEVKNRETEMQKNIIETKQKEILDSILYAKRIQNSLLPSERYIKRSINHLKK